MAIKQQTKIKWSFRGQLVYAIFSIFGNSLLALLFLRFIAIVYATLWWYAGRSSAQISTGPADLFVGFGAGSEEFIWKDFEKSCPHEVHRINQTDPQSLSKIANPPIMDVISCAWNEAALVIQGLKHTKNPYIKEYSTEWLSSSAIRIGPYAYAIAWAAVIPSYVRRISFISSDVVAFACVKHFRNTSKGNMTQVEYIQHGLIRKSLIFPEYHHITALTTFEAAHFANNVPSASVSINQRGIKSNSHHRNACLIFASIYDSKELNFKKEQYLGTIRDLFCWSEKRQLRIIVRPHPSERTVFWLAHFPHVEVADPTKDIGFMLSNEFPIFVVSWTSTALIDALRQGIIPLMLAENRRTIVDDMVFPLADIALNWPEEMDLIQTLSVDPELYRKELKARQCAVFGTAG